MARIVKGRPLTSDQVRSLNTDLRNQGLRRELTRAIGRGDSPTSINKIFKSAGYNLSRLQTIQVISESYRPSTSLRYFDALRAKFGSRSAINSENLNRAGWSNNVQIKSKITYDDNTSFTVTIEFDGANYPSLDKLIEDVNSDLNENYANKGNEIGTVEILNIRFY